MPRPVALAMAVALLGAGCSGSTGDSTSTSPVATTLALPPGLEGAEALGIGDALFPTLGNPGYDVGHYTLDLRFDPQGNTLDGLVTIEATTTERLERVNLDFSRLEARAVRVDGTDAVFGAVDEDLVVALPQPISPDTDFTLEVEYGGRPGLRASPVLPDWEVGWYTRGDQHFVLAQPDAAHTLYPSNDHPLDKATYTFNIEVPEGTTAAANGVLAGMTNADGRQTWTWNSASPIASHVVAVVIGPFSVVPDPNATAQAGVAIRHVLPLGTSVSDYRGLERTGEMLVFLETRFGPFPFETYGVALVDGGLGVALENQTLSVIDTSIASSPELFDEFLMHELTHQWYGNSVSLEQWSDLWLSEGLATYASWLWQGSEGTLDLNARITDLHGFWSEAGATPIARVAAGELYDNATYEVGALTFHALRLTVGDEVFFRILQEYGHRFGGSTASSAEFIALATEVSGEDLTAFFEAWLTGSELPDLPSPAG